MGSGTPRPTGPWGAGACSPGFPGTFVLSPLRNGKPGGRGKFPPLELSRETDAFVRGHWAGLANSLLPELAAVRITDLKTHWSGFSRRVRSPANRCTSCSLRADDWHDGMPACRGGGHRGASTSQPGPASLRDRDRDEPTLPMSRWQEQE